MFGVTEIGRMIREEGIREGKAKGKAEGNAELIIMQLTKRFKKVPKEYAENNEITSSYYRCNSHRYI